MDLLSSYDDDSAPSVAAPVSTSNAAPSYRPNSYIPTVAPLASAQSRALVVSAAPSVSIDHSTSGAIQPYMSAQQKVVFHNPTADMMWAPLAGPVPQHSSGMATNTLTGFVESHQLDAYQFDAQYHTFQSRGYAANPSMLTGASTAANTAEFIGKASSHAEMNGATVFDASTKAAQREANHGGIRKRKAQGEASEPSTYLGPWAPYEIEDIEKAEYAKAKTEREAAKKLEEEARKADAEEDDGMGGKRPKAAAPTERTLFHGDSVHDYQGRTYMSPPSELRPEEHSCHIPENLVHTWSGHTKGVNAIRFFPNYGHLLLSGSLDSTVKIWDVYGKRKCLRSYLGHSGGIRDIQFSHDGRQFLSTSFDKYIKLWDTETGQCVQRWTTGKVPFCAQWHGDIDKANEFLTGMQNKKVLQWDARAPSDSPTQEYDEHLGAVNAILFVDNNRRFVSCADDKKLLVWDYGIPVVIKHISEPWMHSMPSLAMHPNQKWFAAQVMDNSIQTYSAKDKFVLNRKKRFTGHYSAGYAAQVSFSPDGHFVLSGDGEGRAFVWDWKTSRVLRKWKCHDQVTIGAAWHPIEQRTIATCSWDGTIKLWD
jgi:pre-mRNA-processing factor 17